jgi:hypothetical protein
MKWTRCLSVVGVITLSAALPARAEQVVEAFRTPFGEIRGVSVNPTDSSVWVASGGSIMHLAADGSIIGQFDGFIDPRAIAVNSTDGSCWFTNSGYGYPDPPELLHLAADGAELLRLVGFSIPWGSPVNSTDGSCWALDYSAGGLVHLAEDGTELLRVSAPGDALAVNPNDGSFWAGGGSLLVHLAEDGTALSQATYSESIGSVSVSPADGSCWATSFYGRMVVHLAADGAELWRGDFENPREVSVSETDGSCWVTGGGGSSSGVSAWAAHLAADGTELVRVTDLTDLRIFEQVAVDPTDGSCWIGEWDTGRLLHLASDGTELWRGGNLFYSLALSAATADGSCWTSTFNGGPVVHLAADGSDLWSGTVLSGYTYCLSADRGNGSCWVAGADNWDGDNPRIVHLAADGTELLRSGTSEVLSNGIAANPSDGSCWLVSHAQGGGHYSLVHLAQDGSEVLHLHFTSPVNSISVNPTDNSVWVVSYPELRHLAEDGTELLRVTPSYGEAYQASVVPGDGSCWYTWSYGSGSDAIHIAADGTLLAWAPNAAPGAANGADGSYWWTTSTEVVHVGARGEELWRGPAIGAGQTGYGGVSGNTISVNSSDGSAWVSLEGGQLARLEVPGWRVPRFYDVPSYFWAFEAVEACFDAGIVKGYTDGLCHPEYTVTRDQMAVYISRALAGGDGNIPDGPATPSFSDVPSNHWAYKHIEYAVSQNVVKGYTDGTYLPTVTVDRGTMAVYVARAIVTPHGDEGLVGYTPPETPTFSDVATDHWAYRYIEYIAQDSVAVSQGYGDGTYRPAVVVTRDQMAVYVARAFHLMP